MNFTLFPPLIAKDISQAGISFFDFFSIGHICMGIGMFLFFHFLRALFKRKLIFSPFVLSIIGAIAWELIENILFFELGIKFEGRRDSIFNLSTDILLVIVSADLMQRLEKIFRKNKRAYSEYFLTGIAIFLFFLFLYFVFRGLTLR